MNTGNYDLQCQAGVLNLNWAENWNCHNSEQNKSSGDTLVVVGLVATFGNADKTHTIVSKKARKVCFMIEKLPFI